MLIWPSLRWTVFWGGSLLSAASTKHIRVSIGSDDLVATVRVTFTFSPETVSKAPVPRCAIVESSNLDRRCFLSST
jgi:hypothetical protein